MRDKIYLAEDYDATREMIVEAIGCYFPSYGNNIREFDNGKSLYDAIIENEKEIRLVLTDNEMPIMNGLDVIEKCSKLYPDTPFIQMSGKNIGREALDVGARDFILKPFKMEDFRSVLRKYL